MESDPDINTDATTAEALRLALSEVIDPELGIDIVALGLVYHASIADGVAQIAYTLTSPACPLGEVIDRDIRAAVSGVPGVASVETRLVFEPAWSPRQMSPEIQAFFGFDAGPAERDEPGPYPLFPDDDLWTVPPS